MPPGLGDRRLSCPATVPRYLQRPWLASVGHDEVLELQECAHAELDHAVVVPDPAFALDFVECRFFIACTHTRDLLRVEVLRLSDGVVFVRRLPLGYAHVDGLQWRGSEHDARAA